VDCRKCGKKYLLAIGKGYLRDSGKTKSSYPIYEFSIQINHSLTCWVTHPRSFTQLSIYSLSCILSLTHSDQIHSPKYSSIDSLNHAVIHLLNNAFIGCNDCELSEKIVSCLIHSNYNRWLALIVQLTHVHRIVVFLFYLFS